MNITEHEMRGLLTGKCLPGDMRLNEELPAYLVRKFAELKAQRDALASENAALLDFDIDEFRNAGPYQPDDSILGKLKTPATAAYLNSVRAEGVDDLATFAGEQYQQHAGDKSQQKKWKSVVFLCTQFAAQLRAGKDGE